MKIICKTSRAKVVEGRGHRLDLMVTLRAPQPAREHVRPSLCILPVVDVSGSMAGAKLAAVKDAPERLVGHLVPGDRLGLVTFDNEAREVMPVFEVTEARKHEFIAAVRGLAPGSSTNLGGGLLLAHRVAMRAELPGAVRGRLVLLTDGQANAGPAVDHDALVDLVRKQLSGVTVSAFGYGMDCEQSVLADIAQAGGGSYAFIQDEDAVLTAFARELGGLVATYAADLRVQLEPLAGEVREERPSDLLFQGQQATLFTLAVASHARAKSVEVATVRVSWKDAAGVERTASTKILIDHVARGEEDEADDAEVVRLRDERLLSLSQQKADRLARAGELDAAKAVLVDAKTHLSDPKLVLFLEEKLISCYQDRSAFEHGSSLRASSQSAFRGQRSLLRAAEVSEVFALHVTDAEGVERALRKSKKPSARPKRLS